MQTWKVKLSLVNTPEAVVRTGKPAEHVDTFGIQAKSIDDARVQARAWLEKRGYKVRSVNFTPTPRELIAYASPPVKA